MYINDSLFEVVVYYNPLYKDKKKILHIFNYNKNFDAAAGY